MKNIVIKIKRYVLCELLKKTTHDYNFCNNCACNMPRRCLRNDNSNWYHVS